MRQRHKGNTKTISHGGITFLLAILTIFFVQLLRAGNKPGNSSLHYLLKDTIPLLNSNDSVIPTIIDTIIQPHTDSIPFKIAHDTLTDPIDYKADDSMVFDIPAQKLYLYGKTSNVKFADNELSAPEIAFDQRANTVNAHLKKDSTGKVVAYPTFTQADFKSISDTIVFNMRTGKGLTKGTYTQQGEMFVYGEKIKKVDPQVFYAQNGRFTSCNLDTPHFAFVSKKIKFINKKMAFTGPVHPEVEGVPLPIVLPFGIYPLIQGRHSGFIAPNVTANDQLGMAMEGIGYYKILSDNWDVVTRGTLYSYGGWNFNVNPRYFKRYHYQGNFSFDMQHFKTGFKGDPDYRSSNTFLVRWAHSVDSKARPGVTFSANVEAGSSKFNEQVPNSPARNFKNTMASSISFSKTWKDKPYNLSISANHNQNTSTRQIILNLPDVSFNVNTLYPLRRKDVAGDYKWYENLGMALITNARSATQFYDTLPDIGKQALDNLKWGARHQVPISLSLPSIGPFQVAPSVSYNEMWTQEKFIRRWNPMSKKVDTIIQNGFYTARDMSYGIGVTTRIFGMFGFGKNSKLQAIRHEIRPNISASYKPNFNAANYYNTQVDTTGRTQRYSYYERSLFGYFSEQKFAGLNFNLDNIIQMKVRSSKDTSAQLKKVSLIDGFNISGSYNFLLDSFQLANLSIQARSNLFEKINITANAMLDPYLYDTTGRRINKLVWTKHPISLGKMMTGGISLQSSFTGGDKKNKSAQQSNKSGGFGTPTPGMNMDEYQQESAYIRNNPNEFVDFSSPWDLALSYSLRFTRVPVAGSNVSFKTSLFQDVTFSGNISLSPKWKIGASGSYNITNKELGVLSMNISRDLHCWQMNLVISPVGKYRFFTINISPKSNLLRDIKVNRTRYFYDL